MPIDVRQMLRNRQNDQKRVCVASLKVTTRTMAE